MAHAVWRLVDEVFKAADSTADCAPGFSAKSVQIADIYEVPPAVTSRTAYLALWAAPNEPVLVACPELPKVLLEPKDARLADTRIALHSVVWEICERLNIVAPAARALSSLHDADRG